MVTIWCVKVTCLRRLVGNDELAKEFGIEENRATVPRNQSGPNFFAWINKFADENEAHKFAKKWDRKNICSYTITCKSVERNDNGRARSVSIATSRSSMTQNQAFTNWLPAANQVTTMSMLDDTTSKAKHKERDDDHGDNRNVTTINSITLRQSRQDKHSFQSDSKPIIGMATVATKGMRSSSTFGGASKPYVYPRDDTCSDDVNDTSTCKDGFNCENFDCKASHPIGRTKKCQYAAKCTNAECKCLHPSLPTAACTDFNHCQVWQCPASHSENRPKNCLYGPHCYIATCTYLHPSSRKVCFIGVDCKDLDCSENHPPGRSSICDQGFDCGNYYCHNLHPATWNPCEDGRECVNPICPYTSHPPDRIMSTILRFSERRRPMKALKLLKTKEQRQEDRKKANLPILACEKDFCQRLETERVLVVTAETGSGKSTQLPQYAAEYFHGLVVCTQPRAIAAISLARRVADEYDGTSVGESVGYEVGRRGANMTTNKVPGKSIVFMTDAALIQKSQLNRQLDDVRVLIIDESHERSLNTDIVLGLAKLLLCERTSDFYVVIASATIMPDQFLRFFDRNDNQALNVPGRTYHVEIEYIPKPDDSDEDHVVSTLLKVHSQHEGHTLVFLPGQQEIEQAIKLFSANIPNNCVALPLHGALSPEEQTGVLQFDENPSEQRRMVIFCTNIAETSLTIKNTRLVIDSGLAKEARFDPRRRFTIIETVRISKSSATQRTGRAGRTDKGHCIRLYKEDELQRLNIEPEIHRSSLDLIVLQLLRLELDPMKFPFMDSPNDADLHASLTLLNQLSCIQENKSLSRRGELFNELGLDPRLSAFLVDSYLEHGPIIELTATIVAILTAPGSIFIMGGATKEIKQAALGRVSLGAQQYESDLIYFNTIYNQWKKIGVIDPKSRICVTCQKVVKREQACRLCRLKYSCDNNLNSKILYNVENSSDVFIKIFKNQRWELNSGFLTNVIESDFISKYLLKHFPEHYGYLLVPHLPNEGAYLQKNDLRVRITRTSVFVQRRTNKVHFIAMSVTQLPNKEYVIERLHPVNPPNDIYIPILSQLEIIENVGWEWNTEIRKKMKTYGTTPWTKWLVYEYDQNQCKFIVWGDTNTKNDLCHNLNTVTQSTRDDLLDRNRSLDCGPIRGLFSSGLTCIRIDNMHHMTSSNNRIDLQHVPCRTLEEFHEWFESKAGCTRQFIRDHNFRSCVEPVSDSNAYEAPQFFVVLNSDDFFNRVMDQIPKNYINPCPTGVSKSVHMSEKTTWGRQLILKVKDVIPMTEEQVKTILGNSIISCKRQGKKGLSVLHLTNLPAKIEEQHIKTLLGKDIIPRQITILPSDSNNREIGSTTVRITFDDPQLCDKVFHSLQSRLCTGTHMITIFSSKKQNYIKIPVSPTCNKLKMEPSEFLITTKSRQDAHDIYSKSWPNWTVHSSSCVTVTHLELHPDLKNSISYICSKFKVHEEYHPLLQRGDYQAARYYFTGNIPSATALAASMLYQITSPIVIKLSDNRQRYFFKELFKQNLMQTWAKELKLVCEEKDKYGAIVQICGPQIEQGQLMRRIGDYSDQFDDRFIVYDLNTTTVGYFGRQKAADVRLQEIDIKCNSEGCSVTLDRRTSSIIFYAQPNATKEAIHRCKTDVEQLLKLVTNIVDDDDDSDISDTIYQQDCTRECAFCKHKKIATRTFRICGHAYCRCAVSTLKKLPLTCPKCQLKIHIQDIIEIFCSNRGDLIQLCKTAIQNYLESTANPTDEDLLFCPNESCEGLIIRSKGYQICYTCGHSVCGKCNLIDDEWHENRTCVEREQFQKEKTEFFPQLFKAVKEFVKDNWPPLLPNVLDIICNPYIEQPNYPSLTRFYAGVHELGQQPPPDLKQGFFAFHGTSPKAVESICHSGFDPSRRSGQAYGPGEYFGVTAAVSHGYSKKDNPSTDNYMMIVAYLLKSDRVKTFKDFCYVVNNPIDWKTSFNLPVALITYGKKPTTGPSFSLILKPTLASQLQETTRSITWKSPFRWYWRKDNGNFEPYNDKINQILEEFYEKWKIEKGPSSVVTPPLIRYIDDLPQTYRIDFVTNRQTHERTHFVRPIERKRSTESTFETKMRWFYRNEYKIWTLYESMVQKQIDDAYQSYISCNGPSKLNVQFPGRPEQYQINFVMGTQKNTISNETREIKHE
ncbi:hypothetical protein I4U23_004878 [Adineta vaga]|nr:hypothetical protein I4U23_004878 [Adineta vaga]